MSSPLGSQGIVIERLQEEVNGLRRDLAVARAARHAIEAEVGDKWTSPEEPGVLCGIRNMRAAIERGQTWEGRARGWAPSSKLNLWDKIDKAARRPVSQFDE